MGTFKKLPSTPIKLLSLVRPSFMMIAFIAVQVIRSVGRTLRALSLSQNILMSLGSSFFQTTEEACGKHCETNFGIKLKTSFNRVL